MCWFSIGLMARMENYLFTIRNEKFGDEHVEYVPRYKTILPGQWLYCKVSLNTWCGQVLTRSQSWFRYNLLWFEIYDQREMSQSGVLHPQTLFVFCSCLLYYKSLNNPITATSFCKISISEISQLQLFQNHVVARRKICTTFIMVQTALVTIVLNIHFPALLYLRN